MRSQGHLSRVPLLPRQGDGQTVVAAIGKATTDAAEFENLCIRARCMGRFGNRHRGELGGGFCGIRPLVVTGSDPEAILIRRQNSLTSLNSQGPAVGIGNRRLTTTACSPIESHAPESPSAPSPRGYSTLDAICLPVSATGFSLVFATLLSAWCFGGGFYRQLLQTDNPYVAGFAASVVVFACFAMASGLAWWFGSRRVAFLAAAVFLLSIATLMIAADAIHDFGEGDQIIGIWGIGVGSGGTFGLLALTMRRRTPLVIGAVLPFLIYACFYLNAISHLGWLQTRG